MNLDRPFFSQRKLFKARDYFLQSDRLIVVGRRFFVRFESGIPLEMIQESRFGFTNYSRPLMWTTVILTALAIFSGLEQSAAAVIPAGEMATNFYAVSAIFAAVLLGLSYERLTGLHCNGDYEVIFFRGKPSEDAVEDAIDRILQARHIHYQTEIGQYAGIDILEELFKIKSLYDQQLVNHDEFARLTLRLLDQDWRWSGPPPEQH